MASRSKSVRIRDVAAAAGVDASVVGDEVAEAVVWLAGAAAATGSTLRVDGGFLP